MSDISVFFERKDEKRDMFNFNLGELTNNFSFYDFVHSNLNKDTLDYGGFLVITDKQYIVGYNAGFGMGSHYSSYARFMKDKSGGGKIYNIKDAKFLSDKCMFNYITAKIYYEETKNEGSLVPKRFGGLYFTMPIRKISENQLKLFKAFYYKYNEDLEYAIKKSNGTFSVSYQVPGRFVVNNLPNLDDVLKYLETIVDRDYIPQEENEIIIGQTFNKIKKL